MDTQRWSGLESLSIGSLLIAFAVAILIGWQAAAWWLVIPVFMIESGVFYLVVGIVTRPRETGMSKQDRESIYYIFWGGTLGLLGSIWLLDWQYPGNVPLLAVIFILWLGGIVIVLSMPRLRGGRQAIKQ